MISEKAIPPVCRVVEYKKFLYEQKKKEKELKAKQQKVVVKEIRFGPQTDDHDYEFKKRHARAFLEEGSKLKAYVFFKGRSIIFTDQGEILSLRLAQELEDVGKVEQLPKLEGKRMIMMMGPKKQVFIIFQKNKNVLILNTICNHAKIKNKIWSEKTFQINRNR